jgi:hypothetical protein
MITVEKLMGMSKEEFLSIKNVDMKENKDNVNCTNCTSCKSCYYSCKSCYYCNSCISCIYCISCNYCNSCNSCTDCYGINNGKNLKYVVKGVQLTKEQYQEFMQKMGL